MIVSKQKVQSIEPESLCKGWAFATIEDMIGEDGVFSDGDWVESKDQNPSGDVRLIQLADIGDGVYRNRSNRYLTRSKAIELNCTFLRPNDVLIARMPDPLGRACIFPGDSKDSVTAVDVCIVRTGTSGFNHKWLMFTTNSLPIRTVIASLQSGSTRKRISRKNLAKILFPTPPLPEQKRIVAKIEELFTKLDAGVEALKKVRQELKRYRQAVLKNAFEGKLTEKWRQAHKGELESASKLLEKIAKEGEKQGKGKRQKKLPPLDKSNLPELPEEWEWTQVGDLTDMTSGKAFKKKEYTNEGIRLFQIANVSFGRTLWESIAYLPLDYPVKYPKLTLKAGDVLMALNRPILNGALKVCVLRKEDVPAILYQRVGRLDFYIKNISPFFFYYAESPFFLKHLQQSLQGVDQPFVNKPRLLAIPMPLTSLQEQTQIIREIERHFSIIDQIEQTIEQSVKQSDRLRQSILKRAFEGKLVPQDPTEESAERLLERIRAQKTNTKRKLQ